MFSNYINILHNACDEDLRNFLEGYLQQICSQSSHYLSYIIYVFVDVTDSYGKIIK